MKHIGAALATVLKRRAAIVAALSNTTREAIHAS